MTFFGGIESGNYLYMLFTCYLNTLNNSYNFNIKRQIETTTNIYK